MKIIGLPERINKNLHNLFGSNYEKIKDLTYYDYVSYLIENNEVVLEIKLNEFVNELDEVEIALLKESLKNFKLSLIFKKLVKLEIDENLIKKGFKEDLDTIFSKLKSENSKKYNRLKRQVLFITHDHYPRSWCYMYSKGDFPILTIPEYFKFNYSNELFLPNQHIHFKNLWQPLIEFEKIVDDLGLYNQLMNDSEIYQSIYNSYKYKYFILLNEVISENEEELFNDFPILKPFYVFGNEHDEEYINLHIIE